MVLVLVFGAAGNFGLDLVKALLAAGHKVKAFVRTPSKLKISDSNLEAVKGDAQDDAAVKAAIKGVDVVISVANLPPDGKFKGGFQIPIVKSIHAGMKQHGVKRFLIQAGVAVRTPAEKPELNFFVRVMVRKFLMPYVAKLGGHLADFDLVLEYLINEANDLDWTVTRPPVLVDKPSKGKVVEALQINTPKTITTELAKVDLADYYVAHLQDIALIKKAPVLTYAPSATPGCCSCCS